MTDGGPTLTPEAAAVAPHPTVVGIGASAGGLAALTTLLGGLPPDTGLAYVVVIHLSPEHDSQLAELLQPHVQIPIQQVNATVALEPDRVYVIPPNANLNAIDTHLRLSKLEEQRQVFGAEILAQRVEVAADEVLEGIVIVLVAFSHEAQEGFERAWFDGVQLGAHIDHVGGQIDPGEVAEVHPVGGVQPHQV